MPFSDNRSNAMEGASSREIRPELILVVLTSMFTLVFVERGHNPPGIRAPTRETRVAGVMASNAVNGEKQSDDDPDGSGLQGEFGLSNFQDGLLSSLYMVGLLIGSPLFSHCIRYMNPFHLVGIGITLWTIAVLLCGLSWDFYSMALCRTCVGFGEAALLAIGPTYIDDRAPRDKVTVWLAVLYTAIPAGFALGFVFGAVVGGALGWRGAFVTESLLMVPFIVICFTAPSMELNMGAEVHPRDGSSQLAVFWKDAKIIFSHAVYVVALVGNALHNAVLGVLAYWGAKACEKVFRMDDTDVWVGGILLLSGPAGILLGGALVDRVGSGISKALYVGATADLLATCLLVPSILFIRNFYYFIIPFSLSFVCVFAQTAPVTVVSLWSVPLHLRPLAISFATVGLHLFGDVPSPAIEGAILDFLEGPAGRSEATAYRLGFSVWGVSLFAAAVVFYVAARIGRNAKDYRAQPENPESEEGSEDLPLLVDTSPQQPL